MKKLIGCTIAGITIGLYIDNRRKKVEEAVKEREDVRDMAIDSLAVTRATDVINGKIERGEIANYSDLSDAVLQEFAFQQIIAREEQNPS